MPFRHTIPRHPPPTYSSGPTSRIIAHLYGLSSLQRYDTEAYPLLDVSRDVYDKTLTSHADTTRGQSRQGPDKSGVAHEWAILQIDCSRTDTVVFRCVRVNLPVPHRAFSKSEADTALSPSASKSSPAQYWLLRDTHSSCHHKKLKRIPWVRFPERNETGPWLKEEHRATEWLSLFYGRF
jgi:hypothetical protein